MDGTAPLITAAVKRCLLLLVLAAPGSADASGLRLSQPQGEAFRGWFTRIVGEQLRQGPNPRWQHRDCAGLVQFAVAESLRVHNAKWLRSNGISNRYLPPEVALDAGQQVWRQPWLTVQGQKSAYVEAWQLVQANTRLVGRDLNQALPGDLLYFDQGADQHLMVWLGSSIAYHTGQHPSARDSGLRSVSVNHLMTWKDTRWQPVQHNPDFIGVFRFSFLP